MKDKQYRLAQLKYQLADKRNKGVRKVVWKLNRAQWEYVTEVLHYEVTPYLYRIQTKKLICYKATTSSLLKELHHANKRGKRSIVKKLSAQQRRLLDESGIKYWIEKYQINLF